MFAAIMGAPCDMELAFTNEEDLLRVPMKKEGSSDTEVRSLPYIVESTAPVHMKAPRSGRVPLRKDAARHGILTDVRTFFAVWPVQELYLFTDKEDVSGTVKIKPNGKPVAHEGIKIECIGQIGEGIFPASVYC